MIYTCKNVSEFMVLVLSDDPVLPPYFNTVMNAFLHRDANISFQFTNSRLIEFNIFTKDLIRGYWVSHTLTGQYVLGYSYDQFITQPEWSSYQPRNTTDRTIKYMLKELQGIDLYSHYHSKQERIDALIDSYYNNLKICHEKLVVY